MRLRATCHGCRKDFLFFELYMADPADRDRCPRCNRHLGIPGIATMARTADESTTALLEAFGDLAARRSTFTVQAEPWIPQLVDAVRRTAVRDERPPLATGARR